MPSSYIPDKQFHNGHHPRTGFGYQASTLRLERHLTDYELAEAKRLFESGASVRAVCRALRITRHTSAVLGRRYRPPEVEPAVSAPVSSDRPPDAAPTVPEAPPDAAAAVQAVPAPVDPDIDHASAAELLAMLQELR